MIDNNIDAIMEWLKNCNTIDNFLFFNATKIENNNVSIIPISSENYIKKYMRSGGQKQFEFVLRFVKLFDENTSDINIINFLEIEKVIDWIEIQNKNRNFPILKKGRVFCVECLENSPVFTGTSENGMLATYELQVRIKYFV